MISNTIEAAIAQPRSVEVNDLPTNIKNAVAGLYIEKCVVEDEGTAGQGELKVFINNYEIKADALKKLIASGIEEITIDTEYSDYALSGAHAYFSLVWSA